MADALDVARHLLQLAAAEGDGGDGLSHLRLQKLLYYAQGWHLATFGRPLFAGRIEAWVNGPVVRETYSSFADYKNQIIPPERFGSPKRLSPQERQFLNQFWGEYKRHSASSLWEMTHREPPWLQARGDRPPNEKCSDEITQESMLEFFRGKLAEKELPPISFEELYESAEQADAGAVISHGEMLSRLGR